MNDFVRAGGLIAEALHLDGKPDQIIVVHQALRNLHKLKNANEGMSWAASQIQEGVVKRGSELGHVIVLPNQPERQGSRN
jgi:hypothetical protein